MEPSHQHGSSTEENFRLWLAKLAWPIFALLWAIFRVLTKLLLSWWLSPILQRKANKALWEDIKTSTFFINHQVERLKHKKIKILPFDYASVDVFVENVRLGFTRGRGEFNVYLSPRDLLSEIYELSIVIAALDSIPLTEVDTLQDLSHVDRVLNARWDDINTAFSKTAYSEFKDKISVVRDNTRVITHQMEWELNKRLRRL